MANECIKRAARQSNIKLWQVAALWGCNDSNFSRKLRLPFSSEDERRALAIIEQLRREGGSNATDAYDSGSSATCESR